MKRFKDINQFRPELRYCPVWGKPMYSKRAAQEAKNRRWERGHVALRVYLCWDCNMHHLTSHLHEKPKKGKIKWKRNWKY